MSGKDLYRETPLRYLGYANEIGEAFRHYIGHKNVRLTYAVATGYCIADTIDKTSKCYRHNSLSSKRMSRTIFTAVDTLTWQLLASVLIPGFTINRVCKYTGKFLETSKIPKDRRSMIVTATGLIIIPFIIHPIDRFVDLLLNTTLRKLRP